MYNSLKEAHNILGMTILFTLFFVLIFILIAFLRKKPFRKSSKITALIGLIVMHVQILIGAVLYFLSPLGISNLSGESMQHPISRFYALEHPVGMVLAAVLITIGYSQSKNEKLSSSGRYKRILLFYATGTAIVVYLIPWFLWS